VQLTNREIAVNNQLLFEILTVKKMVKGLPFMIIMGTILGLLSPFGMSNIPLTMSIPFWIITCIIGYLIYAPFIHIANRFLYSKISQVWLRVAIAVLAAGILMSFIVPLLSRLFFPIHIDYLVQVSNAFVQSFIIGSIITTISLMKQLIKSQKEELAESKNIINEQALSISSVDDAPLNELMNKLPIEKRGQLLCLEMDDHYLTVYTSKGHHLVLMRFKDALILLKSYNGLQTHRSWWVAQDAVISVEREARKTFLKLSNDLLVPVSRTYLKNLTNYDLA
jgi:hypothetical protein